MARVALIYAGQTPRPDVILDPLDGVLFEAFGALDGLDEAAIDDARAKPGDFALMTRLEGGRNAAFRAEAIYAQLELLLARLDGEGFAALVIMSTGIFRSFTTRTPLIHGQRVIDAWINALVMGDCRIGLIYPLPGQDAVFDDARFGTMMHSSSSTAQGRLGQDVGEASRGVGDADLIVMHSVGYTDAMAAEAARTSGKPVVTAKRIIQGAMRALLVEAGDGLMSRAAGVALDGVHLIDVLDRLGRSLTPRERSVMALALEGDANKVIARKLNISHRTVDIHRARGMTKLGARSVADLIRRAVMLSEPRG